MNASNFELWHALQDMEVRHWYDVNLNDGKTVHEFYTEDALFAVGPQERRGLKAIREFYEARAKRGVRTARHVLTNFRIVPGETIRATGMICLYAGDKAPPLDSKPPVLVADLANEYVSDGKGGWLYRSHILKPVFVGDDPFVRHAVGAS
jgi:ketosteroid isomerase-like protein